MKTPCRILIVDDEKIICELLTTFLGQKGYETRAVYSGEEALGVLEIDVFDVVITDLQMQKVSGFDVIRHVKDTLPETLIFMITGSGCQGDRSRALEYGVDQYFLKPVVLNDLLDHLPPPLTKER